MIIAGTRPEIIKCAPIYLYAKSQGLDYIFCNTGQHKEMTEQAFKIFNFMPDISLDIMQPNQTINEISANLYRKLPSVIEKFNPDAVLVQGDTTTAMISALIAFNLKRQVIHLEAGLRTHNKLEPYPEEINRRLISVVTDIHLCPTQLSADNLYKEVFAQNVCIVGNTIVDAIRIIDESYDLNTPHYIREKLQGKGFVLITAHRRESFGAGILNICKAIRELAKQHPEIDFVYPVHPNPNIKDVVTKELDGIANVLLLKPVDYIEILSLIKNSLFCLSDSGGIQEEAPSFNKYTIVMRNYTERMESVNKGYSYLVGTDTDKIVSKTNELLSGLAESDKTFVNPYGDGHSSEKIIELLAKIL